MSNLQSRAKFYTHVLIALFKQQGLSGFRLKSANRAARHLSLGLQLANPNELDKALKLAESIALSSNVDAVLAQRITGLVVYQFQLSQGFWQSYTRQDLPIDEAIGLAEQKRPVPFTFEYPHSLVAGTSGSGKTEAIKSIIVSLCTIYTPDDLSMIICDPHSDLSEFENMSHLAMPIAQSAREISNALLYRNEQLIYRKRENIKDAKLLLLIIDEACDTLIDSQSLEIVKQIVREGRKFRIHCVIGTQKPSHKVLPDILDNLLNRFVGTVSDARVSANLTGHSGLQAHKLTGKGDFLHVQGIEATRFQVAMATKKDFDNLERAEIKPVEVEPDLVILPDKKNGRPCLEVQPDKLAHYWHRGPMNISISQAKKALNLSRAGHELHKQFCLDMGKEYRRIRSEYNQR